MWYNGTFHHTMRKKEKQRADQTPNDPSDTEKSPMILPFVRDEVFLSMRQASLPVREAYDDPSTLPFLKYTPYDQPRQIAIPQITTGMVIRISSTSPLFKKHNYLHTYILAFGYVVPLSCGSDCGKAVRILPPCNENWLPDAALLQDCAEVQDYTEGDTRRFHDRKTLCVVGEVVLGKGTSSSANVPDIFLRKLIPENAEEELQRLLSAKK